LTPTVQIIEKDGQPEWVIIPYNDYLRLSRQAELLGGAPGHLAENASVEEGGRSHIPTEITQTVQVGENPIKAWRERRQMTQQQLAKATGISTPYLSQLESNKRTGSARVLKAIAKALGASLDELVGSH
jgi:DNA-binding XRE family transcriptional regulator